MNSQSWKITFLGLQWLYLAVLCKALVLRLLDTNDTNAIRHCLCWLSQKKTLWPILYKKILPIITTSIIAVVTHIRGTLHGGHLRGGGYSYKSKSKSKSKGNNKESCFPNDQLRQLQPVCIINVEILIQSEDMISRFSLVLTCRNPTLAVTLTPFSPSICRIYFICRIFICRIFHL